MSGARRKTEPPVRCPCCLRRDVPEKIAALKLLEHVEAARAPGGEFVILEIVSEWRATSETPGGDFPPGRYEKHRCPRCSFQEIVGPAS